MAVSMGPPRKPNQKRSLTAKRDLLQQMQFGRGAGGNRLDGIDDDRMAGFGRLFGLMPPQPSGPTRYPPIRYGTPAGNSPVRYPPIRQDGNMPLGSMLDGFQSAMGSNPRFEALNAYLSMLNGAGSGPVRYPPIRFGAENGSFGMMQGLFGR